MSSPTLEEVLPWLPQAVLRVDRALRVEWLDPGFQAKTGLVLEAGGGLLDWLEPGRDRDALEGAVREGRSHTCHVITSALKQVRAQVKPTPPSAPEGAWVLFDPSGVDDEIAFSQALQEIARAVGESLDVDAVCAAAVLAIVRCAQVGRAEVYLSEEGKGLHRVAVSDVDGAAPPKGASGDFSDTLRQALATRQPQIGIQRGRGEAVGSIFAALPLLAQRRTAGLLLLYKEQGTSFSVRELDLWSAAAGQLAVAVENARLLREAQAALRVREEFMSIASHELKTPLTPLKLGLYTMERKIAQGQPVELSTVLKSKRQVDRLAGLVNDLLDASRLELGKLALHPSPLEVGHLVAEVVDQFRQAVDRAFTVDVPARRVWVRGDRDRLEQVLVNLLENAHKYSPPGEAISVEIKTAEGAAHIQVRDRGIGIPGQDQAQVFQRFYRARNVSHRNISGLGLGLFISHSIAKLHGGALALASAEGKGSTFTLSLPRMPQEDVRRLSPRLLLLDEDRGREAEAERALRAEGFDVLVARDGGEALRKAAHLPVDLVLLSATTPLLQATLFLESFASLPRARPVPLMLAGDALPAWAHEGMRLCPRPACAEQLVAAVRSALRGEPAAIAPGTGSEQELSAPV